MFQLDFFIYVVLVGAALGAFPNRFTATVAALVLAGFTMNFGLGWGIVTFIELLLGFWGGSLFREGGAAGAFERIVDAFRANGSGSGSGSSAGIFGGGGPDGSAADGRYRYPSDISSPVRGGNHIASTFRAYKIIRNAAIDLFHFYGFDLIPPQFWVTLEREQDPVKAFKTFFSSFGCDPELIRNHNTEEKRRAARMLEALTKLSGYDRYLSDAGRKALLSRFFAKDYDRALEAADTLRAAEAIFESINKSRAKRAMAAFAALLKNLEDIIEDPVSATKEDLRRSSSDVGEFLILQVRAETLELDFEREVELVEVIHGDFPFSDRELNQLDQLNLQIENILEELYADATLSKAEITRRLDEIDNILSRFKSSVSTSASYDQWQSAHGHSRGGSDYKSSGSGASDTSWAPYTEKAARQFMGFSLTEKLTKELVSSRYRSMVKELHPDLHQGKSAAEREANHQKMIRLNEAYNLLNKLI